MTSEVDKVKKHNTAHQLQLPDAGFIFSLTIKHKIEISQEAKKHKLRCCLYNQSDISKHDVIVILIPAELLEAGVIYKASRERSCKSHIYTINKTENMCSSHFFHFIEKTSSKPDYSFSSLRSLALGFVTLMANCAALSTMSFLFFEDTLWAISAQCDL